MTRPSGRGGTKANRGFRRHGRGSGNSGPSSSPSPAAPRGNRARRINEDQTFRPALCQFVGYKNSGKTTLICGLIPLLRAKGYSVAVIKHDVHEFETDRPGTDTWRHREAGAEGVAITGKDRSAIFESRGRELTDLIKAFRHYDYVLVEGFKEAPFPKLVLVRSKEDVGLPERLRGVAGTVLWGKANEALASLPEDRLPGQRRFGINDTAAIADFLWRERLFFQNFNI